MSKRQRVLVVALIALVALGSFGVGILARQSWEQSGRTTQTPNGSPTADTAATAYPPAPGSATPPAPTPSLTPLAPSTTPSRPPSAFRERWLLPLIRQHLPTATVTPTPTKTPKPTKTKRPAPTPTPTLPWPAALERTGTSKLGLHVQWNNSPEIMEFVRRMKPPVVKAVGDFGFVDELKRESPSTIVVARIECSPRLDGDPAEAARAFVNEYLGTYLLNPGVDYWEGVNEPQMGDRMAWFAAFEAERARVMAEHGLRVAIGAFSAGTPEWEQFEQFLPAVEAAKRHGGILTVHEYDAPTMQRSAGAGLPGHPNYPDRGALTLRYRWWYRDFLQPRGLVIPLVISEAGVDGWIGNRPGPKGRGWLEFSDYWVDQKLAATGIDAYLSQLNWYDDQVRQDSYVVGFTVFTVGAMNDDWRSYDITDILRHIATYIVAPKAR